MTKTKRWLVYLYTIKVYKSTEHEHVLSSVNLLVNNISLVEEPIDVESFNLVSFF